MLIARHPNGKETVVPDRATFDKLYARRGFTVVREDEPAAPVVIEQQQPAETVREVDAESIDTKAYNARRRAKRAAVKDVTNE